jgi:hypothetical protein
MYDHAMTTCSTSNKGLFVALDFLGPKCERTLQKLVNNILVYNWIFNPSFFIRHNKLQTRHHLFNKDTKDLGAILVLSQSFCI